jgi:imidazolonepropionase-like amidohydrolase
VLQSTTIDGAKFLGLQTANGTVEGGKNANLVLLDEDPIKSVSNLNKIYGVVRAGKFYSRADLDALLMRVEDRAAATPQHQPKPTTP